MCDHPRERGITAGFVRDLDNKPIKVDGQPQEIRYCGLCGHNVSAQGSSRAHVHMNAPMPRSGQ